MDAQGPTIDCSASFGNSIDNWLPLLIKMLHVLFVRKMTKNTLSFFLSERNFIKNDQTHTYDKHVKCVF